MTGSQSPMARRELRKNSRKPTRRDQPMENISGELEPNTNFVKNIQERPRRSIWSSNFWWPGIWRLIQLPARVSRSFHPSENQIASPDALARKIARMAYGAPNAPKTPLNASHKLVNAARLPKK